MVLVKGFQMPNAKHTQSCLEKDKAEQLLALFLV